MAIIPDSYDILRNISGEICLYIKLATALYLNNVGKHSNEVHLYTLTKHIYSVALSTCSYI